MELTLKNRDAATKGEVKRIRREKNIPAILYSKGGKGENVVVEGRAFAKHLYKIEQGTLCAQVFTLKLARGTVRALIKDIQYAVTTYDPLHIDFEELHEDRPVELNIPIRLVRTAECAGVKLGGIVRQVTRYLRIRCLPKDIPTEFALDVADLPLGHSRRLDQLVIPKGVTPLTPLDQVAALVARK